MDVKDKVCISYAGSSIEDIDSAVLLCNWLELRMELCTFSDSEYEIIFSKIDNTIAADLSEKRKDNLLKAIELGVKIVDIDINNPDFEEIYMAAKLNNRQIIISYHNFEELPDVEGLNSFIRLCLEKKANYSKIACNLLSNRDILALAELYKNPLVTNGNIKLLAMGLGKHGPLSRLVALEFGSPFVYCSYNIESATADGQLNASDLSQFYKKLFVV